MTDTFSGGFGGIFGIGLGAAKFATLVETFSAPLTGWTEPSEGSIVAGQYQIVGPVGGAELVTTATTWDLTSSYILVQIVSVTAARDYDLLNLSGADGSGGYVFRLNTAGNLVMESRAAGAFDESGAPFVTYNSTNHKWLRIRHDGTQVHFEASADGATWPATPLRSVTPNSVDETAMVAHFKATNGTLVFDNINNPPSAGANPKVSTLTSTFDSALSTSIWSPPTEGSVTGGTYQIASPSGAVAMSYLRSVFSYDLTSSSVAIQVVSRTVGQTYDPLAMTGSTGAGGYVFTITAANNLEMQVRAAGDFDETAKTSIAYSATNHKWLRIRHNGTSVFFEGSPDGTTFTILRTVTTLSTQDNTAMLVGIGAKGGTLVVDNLNTVPSVSNAKTVSLVETFGGALSTTTWDQPTGGAVSGGAFTLTNLGAKISLTTDALYDLTSSEMLVQVVSASGATASHLTEFGLLGSDGTGGYLIRKDNAGALTFHARAAGSSTDATPVSITYSATTHAWWRIRHDGTNVLFETLSSTGVGGWVTRRTVTPTDVVATALRPTFSAYGAATIDNINNLTITPSNPTAAANKASVVAEAFTSAPSGTIWSIGSGITFSGGVMTLSGTAGTAFKTLSTYDFTSDTVYIQLVSATAGTLTQFGLVTADGSGGYCLTVTADGALLAEARALGSYSDGAATSVTYDANTMKWFKIVETSTTAVFSYAATQNGTYTTLRTASLTDVDETNLYLQVYNATGTSVWDNLNTVPTGPVIITVNKAATLVDDFAGTALNSSKWTPSGASGEITQAEVLNVQARADAPKYTTVAAYDLVASQMRLQVTPGSGSGDTTTVEALSTTSQDYLRAQVKDGVLTASASSGTLATAPAVLAYSGTTHKYLGMRETDGNLAIETSADGITWTIRGQMTTPAWVSSVKFALGSFNSGVASGGGGTPSPVQATPSVPTSVTSSVGDGTATINWSVPANAGTSTITGYRVTRNGNDVTQTNGAGYTVDLPTTARTFTMTGLINGTAYTLTVAAINASGAGTVATVTSTPTGSTGGGTTPSDPGSATVTLTANLGSSIMTVAPDWQGVGSSTYGTIPTATNTQGQYERALDARYARIPVKWNGSSVVSSAGGSGAGNMVGLVDLYRSWGWRCMIVIAGRSTDFDGYQSGDAAAIKNALGTTNIDYSSPNEPDNAGKSAGEILSRAQQIYSEIQPTKVWGWVAASYKRSENLSWAQGMGVNRFAGLDYHHYAMGSSYLSVATAMSQTGTWETEVTDSRSDLTAAGLPPNVNVDEYNYSWRYNIPGHGDVTEFFTAVNTVWQASVASHILRGGGRGMPYATQNGALGLIQEPGNTNPDNRPANTPFPAYWGIAMLTGGQMFSHFKDRVYTSTSTDTLTEIFPFNNEAGGYNLVCINKNVSTSKVAQINVSGALTSGVYYLYQTRQSNPYDAPVKTGPFTYTGGSIKVTLPAMTVSTIVLSA